VNGVKIIIPAATYTNPTKARDDALFMDNFLDGKQLHLRSDATAEYALGEDLLTPTI
jgi:hypothetical protein